MLRIWGFFISKPIRDWFKERQEEIAAFGMFLLRILSLIGVLVIALIGVVGFAAETFFFAMAFISGIGGFPAQLADVISFCIASSMMLAYAFSLGLEIVRKGWDTPWRKKLNFLITTALDNKLATHADPIKNNKLAWWKWLIAIFFTFGAAAVIAAPCYLGYAAAFASAPAAVLIAPAVCFGILLGYFLMDKAVYFLKKREAKAKEEADNPFPLPKPSLKERIQTWYQSLQTSQGRRKTAATIICTIGLVGFAGCNGYLGVGGLLLMLGFSSASPAFIAFVTTAIFIVLIGYYMAAQDPTTRIFNLFVPEESDKKKEEEARDRDDNLKEIIGTKCHKFSTGLVSFTSLLNIVPAFLLAKVIVTSLFGLAFLTPGGIILVLAIAAPIAFTYAMTNYYMNGEAVKENIGWVCKRYKLRDLSDQNASAMAALYQPRRSTYETSDTTPLPGHGLTPEAREAYGISITSASPEGQPPSGTFPLRSPSIYPPEGQFNPSASMKSGSEGRINDTRPLEDNSSLNVETPKAPQETASPCCML